MNTMNGSGLARYIQDWRPSARISYDLISPVQAAALAGLLGGPHRAAQAGDRLPAFWHWLYFLEWPAQDELGPDGHPAQGHFLPPIPARKRMFAGGRLTVRAPMRLGATAERMSALAGVEAKEGRTGELLFVTVRHEIRQDGEIRLVEEQDLVYRSDETKTAVTKPVEARPQEPPVSSSPWQRPLTADPVLLFRFSALTANAHRIHYDQAYTQDVEGYPGLVVHGPLLAVHMTELARRNAPDREIGSVRYRLRRPVFAGDPVLVTGEPAADGGTARMSVIGAPDQVMADAEVTFA
ncbi:FAS1-like dehydratase domain-containing protein [Actinomadura scrupuli]|uniref:FAS1-like dehydratase domain-containing protein n=1 Tax=Actinomadura scrupuli TaxID=559629 RepID=UPI003D996505